MGISGPVLLDGGGEVQATTPSVGYPRDSEFMQMPRFVRGICISGGWFYRLAPVMVQQDEVEPDGFLVLDGWDAC